MDHHNPYMPPHDNVQNDNVQNEPTLEAKPILHSLPEERWPEIDIQVASVEKGWWTRRLWLTGSVKAELYYDPAGHGERVYINGDLATTTSGWSVWHNVAPRIHFDLATGLGYVPCIIDVRAPLWKLLQLSRFELTVAGKLVYQE